MFLIHYIKIPRPIQTADKKTILVAPGGPEPPTSGL